MAISSADIAASDRLRILIISDTADMEPEPEAGVMWRLAVALSKIHDVIIAYPGRTGAQHADFAVIYYNQRNIALLARDSDVAIMTAAARQAHPSLESLGSITAATAGRPGERLGDQLADQLGGKAGQELFVLKPEPAPAATGLFHYLRRLRYHLRQGGITRVALRGVALIKRSIRKRS